ncbi:MAG: inorganic phosphate transporter [Clostridiales bacterium]|nr:inorganic phosphate transporter [Clostridiales bacterium]
MADGMSLVTTGLLIAVILVNGWTDAPNAIATCVATGAMKERRAVALAAVCNFFGVTVMTLAAPQVAESILNLADFGGDARRAQVALCAAMASIVLWAAAAWWFGIPTSESHALIAGISGAAVALNGGFIGLNGAEWGKVLLGLLLSAVFGFGSGFAAARGIEQGKTAMGYGCGGKAAGGGRPPAENIFLRAQRLGAAAMAFLHGAQDGQKFIGVFLIVLVLNGAETGACVSAANAPLWLLLLVSVLMAAGTACGGHRIIETVGKGLTRLDPARGFAADLGAAVPLLLSSLFGIPVSTTHVKTTAVMGAGVAGKDGINGRIALQMVWAWLCTFPGCGLLGFLLAKFFLVLWG